MAGPYMGLVVGRGIGAVGHGMGVFPEPVLDAIEQDVVEQVAIVVRPMVEERCEPAPQQLFPDERRLLLA